MKLPDGYKIEPAGVVDGVHHYQLEAKAQPCSGCGVERAIHGEFRTKGDGEYEAAAKSFVDHTRVYISGDKCRACKAKRLKVGDRVTYLNGKVGTVSAVDVSPEWPEICYGVDWDGGPAYSERPYPVRGVGLERLP